ncbi:transposase [Nocardia sp. CA-128927]|uniref:transposase n=1 Tax=Nocardia sp. CA-128927 TaxID=3239975 RepID=UPI003D9639CA
MAQKKRAYSPEFRDEAVKMVLSGEHGGAAAVARALNINEGTLGNWMARYRNSQTPVADEPLLVNERARLRELERENRELRQKNEFLGKGVPRTREAA